MTNYINNLIEKILLFCFKVTVMEDKNISVITDQTNDPNSSLVGSSMTKAGRLAMELSHENKTKARVGRTSNWV